jgi:hypothetical protein
MSQQQQPRCAECAAHRRRQAFNAALEAEISKNKAIGYALAEKLASGNGNVGEIDKAITNIDKKNEQLEAQLNASVKSGLDYDLEHLSCQERYPTLRK